MDTEELIEAYIAGHEEPKQSELRTLHALALRLASGERLWFFDGKDDTGKVVSNPTIGYGSHTIDYANGKSREFFRIGLSANKSGISIHILGITDKKLLSQTYGKSIGKATVTGYCIKFRKLGDIKIDVLESAIRFGLSAHPQASF